MCFLFALLERLISYATSKSRYFSRQPRRGSSNQLQVIVENGVTHLIRPDKAIYPIAREYSSTGLASSHSMRYSHIEWRTLRSGIVPVWQYDARRYHRIW